MVSETQGRRYCPCFFKIGFVHEEENSEFKTYQPGLRDIAGLSFCLRVILLATDVSGVLLEKGTHVLPTRL